MRKKNFPLTDFALGIIVGFTTALVIFCLIIGIFFFHTRNKEKTKYEEKQIEIEALREDYSNLSTDEFLEIPDVRRATDGVTAEFDRKRDEILQRFRGGNTD
jgi:FAD/FMN-containing dehydrogenase